jgi:hypothetical protein
MKGGGHLRNLKDVGIVMALKNIPYDILAVLCCQSFASALKLNTSPERGSRTVRDFG